MRRMNSDLRANSNTVYVVYSVEQDAFYFYDNYKDAKRCYMVFYFRSLSTALDSNVSFELCKDLAEAGVGLDEVEILDDSIFKPIFDKRYDNNGRVPVSHFKTISRYSARVDVKFQKI